MKFHEKESHLKVNPEKIVHGCNVYFDYVEHVHLS